MSLQHLGFARLPLYRHLASTVSEESPSQDLAQDNKDVLVERVNDLVALLSRSDDLEEGTMTEIHSKVDQIEELIRGRERSPKSPRGLRNTISPNSPRSVEDIFWGPPTPNRSMSMRLPNVPAQRGPHVTSTTAIQIASEAENLAVDLARTVAELHIRRVEADHINGLLLERAEAAAQLVSSLEEQLEELEDAQESSQSELKFLRIQLQAIEVQSSQFILADEDPDLTQSIKNWKAEWEIIDKRTKDRKEKFRISTDSSTFSYSHISIKSPGSLLGSP